MKVKYLSVKDGKIYNMEQFPNFEASGSIKGMKEKYYGKNSLLVRCSKYIYYVGNLDQNKNSEYMTLGESIYFVYSH